jgi:hypothetical protein
MPVGGLGSALIVMPHTAGTYGQLLKSPIPVDSESHVHILRHLEIILTCRRDAFLELGTPLAVTTDNVRRDHKALRALLLKVFPASGHLTVICQDVIHRYILALILGWHVTSSTRL